MLKKRPSLGGSLLYDHGEGVIVLENPITEIENDCFLHDFIFWLSYFILFHSKLKVLVTWLIPADTLIFCIRAYAQASVIFGTFVHNMMERGKLRMFANVFESTFGFHSLHIVALGALTFFAPLASHLEIGQNYSIIFPFIHKYSQTWYRFYQFQSAHKQK